MLGSQVWNETTDGGDSNLANSVMIMTHSLKLSLQLINFVNQVLSACQVYPAICHGKAAWATHAFRYTWHLSSLQLPAGIVLSIGAAIVAYISCEAAQRLKLADSAKLFALTFLLVTFGAQDGVSKLPASPCCATQLVHSHLC